MPSLERIQQFQKSIGLEREQFLQALEDHRGRQNANITAFYKQLLDDLITELQSGDLPPGGAERFIREQVRQAVRNGEISQLMIDALTDDFDRISQYLADSFDLLGRNYNIGEARIIARDRLSDYLLSGNRNIGNRLAVEINTLRQIYTGDELYAMIEDKINVTSARVRTVSDNIIRGYDSEITDNLAQQAGLQLWRYNGDLIEHSRLFCIRLVRMPYCYSKPQILKMNNGMQLNPFTFRGGYNCRHSWAPGEEGWPGFEQPYPPNGPFATVAAEGGSYRITVPQG